MNSCYKIYPELNLGVARLRPGEKSFDELYTLVSDIRNDQDFENINYQITDLRGCIFNFDTRKIAEMASLVEKNIEKDNQKVGVYVTDKPISTAYVQFFFNKLRHKREFCSTLEGAYQLLKMDVTYDDFINLLDI